MIWLANKIHNFCLKIENICGNKLEISALFVYVIGHFLMAIVHEPWYDEAVAWQIARCASIKDILLEIPHYEGHPPLWHFILLPFAKLGAPYELSLTIVSGIFAGVAIALIIWKSPFPRIVRLLLPFTYFFFYQYGVISRPYCVMMLAFVLLAMTYQDKNEKPGKYTLCLMLLCLTSAYGIVIAGGIAIVWVWEIWNKQNVCHFMKSFKEDKRIWWLAGLLILALLLIAEILPKEDTFATNLMSGDSKINSFWICFLYMMFGALTDVSVTSIYISNHYLQMTNFHLLSLIAAGVLGVVLWVSAMLFGRKKGTTLMMVLPYGLYATFAALVYMSTHHIGIGLLLVIFWIWISLNETTYGKINILSKREEELVNSINVLFFAMAIVISLYWNISSCIKDAYCVYATGREEAEFILKNNLDKYQIMVGWDVFYDEEGNIDDMDINHCRGADNVAPYFAKNIFFNFNNGSNKVNYSTHKEATEEYTDEMITEWKSIEPEVLFMNPQLEVVYDDIINYGEYVLVYSKVNSKIWKGNQYYGNSDIYVREDVARLLELEEVKPDYWVHYGGLIKYKE